MKGRVTLVGAGPGRDLITIRGLERIKHADVIVYDDLIDERILSEAPKECEKIYVGKRYGKHSSKQEEINKLLIEKCRAGKEVVRLKGGDSFVFGRGGEEALALMEEGLNWDYIPGVSSAIAVPGNMGIPVTHRGVARSFTVITGHTMDDSDEDYEALAKLISPGESRIDGTLGTIADKAKEAQTPAILVIGHVAGMQLFRENTDPLSGTSVTVCGTNSFVHKVGSVLKREGASVFEIETIRIRETTADIPEDPGMFDWLVFTSSNGIRAFFDEMKRRAYDFRRLGTVKMACIGTGTAETLSAGSQRL